MSEDKLIEKLVEFETKYRIEPKFLIEFKAIMNKLSGLKKFIYVEGEDEYYVKEDDFIRYRMPENGIEGARAEITMKKKPVGATNNIIRREWNWRVDGTVSDTIREGIKDFGFVFNFSIWKGCHIYNFDDATIVFYTVYETTDGKVEKIDNFIEIEVAEEDVFKMTKDQAWTVIVKYEKALESVGLSPQRRLRKSLYEMYRKEIK